MKRHKQTIAKRILARAKLVHRMAMCTDGQRREDEEENQREAVLW